MGRPMEGRARTDRVQQDFISKDYGLRRAIALYLKVVNCSPRALYAISSRTQAPLTEAVSRFSRFNILGLPVSRKCSILIDFVVMYLQTEGRWRATRATTQAFFALMKTIPLFPERQNESETAENVGRFDRNDRRRLLSQGALNYSSQIASTLSSLVLVPFMLLRLGAEAYGFWISRWQHLHLPLALTAHSLSPSHAKPHRTVTRTELQMYRQFHFCQPAAEFMPRWEWCAAC